MKNLAEQMRGITKEVEDRDKLDILFEELVYPKILRAAKRKQTEASFDSFFSSKEDARVKEVLPKVGRLQDLIGTKMKPYLEEKGFKVILCSPAYYTYVRW